MLKLGLTGGIGSGKSTVAHLLRHLGAAVIDADAISRQSTQAGGSAIGPVKQAFGLEALSPDGALNREAMRSLMARDSKAKILLEDIIHPIVGAEINLKLQAASNLNMKMAVIDLPLLAEGGARWRQSLDAIWVVDCLPDTQIKRVCQRSSWPVEQVQGIMALQAGRFQRLACADTVIFNEGISLSDLAVLVKELAEPLL